MSKQLTPVQEAGLRKVVEEYLLGEGVLSPNESVVFQVMFQPRDTVVTHTDAKRNALIGPKMSVRAGRALVRILYGGENFGHPARDMQKARQITAGQVADLDPVRLVGVHSFGSISIREITRLLEEVRIEPACGWAEWKRVLQKYLR